MEYTNNKESCAIGNMNLRDLTILDAKEGLKNKQFSAVELTQAALDQIKLQDKNLNAFITVTEKEALESAKHADTLIAQGVDLALLGIPIALKDLFSTKGIRTTAASNVLDDYIPQFDATVVTKLKSAGAIIVGKTNCDAWAHGSSGENSDFGPAKNPYNLEYVPGGSSSGSPVAVAAGMSLMATGTDTGGSIRLPASFCNVVGLKPTYGRVSRYGIVAMASSLDSIGHFTKTVADNALVLGVTAGQDPLDATTPNRDVPDYSRFLKQDLKGIKIGVPKEYYAQGLDKKMQKLAENALGVLKSRGATVIDITLPYSQSAIAVYYIIQTAEVSSNLARYDSIRYGNDRSYFGEEAKRRIMLGTYVLSAGYYDAYYKKAQQVRTLIVDDFKKAFEQVDAIVAPVSPTSPWKIGAKTDDPLAMYLSDIFTVTANIAGLPGLSVPAGFIDGLPSGIQILGPHFSEEKLYHIGHAYEQETQFWKEAPQV